MKSSEVNFEKRGRLEDHQNCPICGECTCNKHTHRTRKQIIYLTAILVLVTRLAFGADVSYEFLTLDVKVPNRPNMFTTPVDINSKEIVLERTWEQNPLAQGGLIVTPNNKKFRKFRNLELFDCVDTDPTSINDAGQVTGFCGSGAFLRQPNGSILFLNPPGTIGNNATGLGISSNGKVAGQFCQVTPGVGGCLWRGFTWHPVEGYRLIDFIDGFGIGTHTDTAVLAVTANGKALIEYITEDAGNNTLAHGFAIYDNGTFSHPFPLSFEWRGGPYLTMADFNDNEQTIIVFSNNDGTPYRLSLYDDGRFWDIAGWPLNWALVEIGGMSNDGTFVGSYFIPPANPFGPIEIKGFVATLAPQRLGKK